MFFLSVDISQFYEGRKFLHNKMGDYLIEKYHIKRIINENLLDGVPPNDVDMYVFNPKPKQYEPFTKKKCDRLLTFIIEDLKTNARKEVWEYINNKVNEYRITDIHIIGCKNCLINIKTGEVLEKTPKTVLTIYIPVTYDPQQTENKLLDTFMYTLFGDDVEMHSFIYQIIGYGLWPDNFLQKFFILFGEGGNGKSTFLSLLNAFYSRGNVSNLPLSKLSDDKYIGNLYGKLINIGDDIESTTVMESAIIKKTVSGDPVHANPKFCQMFSFTPTQKLLFSANAVPRITDTSQGMADRLILVPFLQRIRGTDKVIPNIVKKIVNSGGLTVLLNRVLKEIPNIMNGIHIPKSVQEATDRHRIETNPVALFIEEMNGTGWRVDTGSSFDGLAEQKSISDLTTVQVYSLYKEWCKDNGYKALANNTFGRELSRLGYERYQFYSGINKKKRYYSLIDARNELVIN